MTSINFITMLVWSPWVNISRISYGRISSVDSLRPTGSLVKRREGMASLSQVNSFQERVPQIIREYSLNQWVDGKVEAREEKGHQVDNVAGA